MITRFLNAAILSVLMLFCLNSIYGQNGRSIKFLPGKKSIVLSGNLVKPKERAFYSLELKKGSPIYVQLQSSNNTLGFDVFDPNGNKIGSPGDEDWSWEDKASSDGVYRIEVYALKGIGTYKLTVKLESVWIRD